MLPHFILRAAQRSKSSLEPLEARIAPAGLQNLDDGSAGVVSQLQSAYVDLALTKTADVATATPSDTITYTLHLSNAGTVDATGVTVSDPVVAGLNFVGTENPGWSLNQAHTAYVFDYGALASGAGADLQLKLHVSPTVPADFTSVTNSATVSDDGTHGPDSNSSNNSGSASVEIIADATLHLTLRSETPEIAHGAKVTYTLIFSNSGDRDAHVILTEQPINHGSTFLPDNPGWTYNATSNVYEYDAGTLLARSGNHSVQYVVQSDYFMPTTVTKLTNSASIGYAPDEAELGNASDDTHPSLDTPVYQGIYVLSPGTTTAGHYTAPKIQVFDITTGKRTDIQVYSKVVRDSIRTALGDFNGDSFDDILVTTEHGLGATEVFDGATGKLMASPLNGLQPFGKNKGSFVAIGDLSPGLSFISQLTPLEVVFGSALGGGAVKIYSVDTGSQSSSGDSLQTQTTTPPALAQVGATFYPFGPKFTGGVRVAIGDVDGDGSDDLVVAQGNFGGLVKVYKSGNTDALLATFQVGGVRYKGGLNLAVGDVDGDGLAEIVTGRNRLSAPTVEVFDYQASSGNLPGFAWLKASFNAFSATYRNGVRVALTDINNDGNLDIIATTGFAGRSQVKIFDGSLYHVNHTATTIAFTGISTPPPAVTPPVVTVVPPLIKSFTAIPSNLNQAVWASATTVVPPVPGPYVIIPDYPFPFPWDPFPFPPVFTLPTT